MHRELKAVGDKSLLNVTKLSDMGKNMREREYCHIHSHFCHTFLFCQKIFSIKQSETFVTSVTGFGEIEK